LDVKLVGASRNQKVKLQDAVTVHTKAASLDCDNSDDLCKQYGKKCVKCEDSELEREFNPNFYNK
jgi:alpha-D-ribose 1-methylphosphonate 5-phosphate C-P lyase